MTSPADFISAHSPCPEGRAFLASCPDLRTAWQTCERPDWMLWTLRRINHTPERDLRLFACACARRALPRFEERYPDDKRPRRLRRRRLRPNPGAQSLRGFAPPVRHPPRHSIRLTTTPAPPARQK